MTRARDVANLIGSGNYSSTTFTATAGQTAFTIAHTQGFVQVFMNGLLLDETVDWTSDGSAVTLTSGAAAGDEIEVVAYNTFSVGDALNQAAADARYYTQSAADTRYVNASGDTMSGDLTIQDPSNTPTLKLSAASASNFLSINRDSSTGHYHIESDETGSSIIMGTDTGSGIVDQLVVNRYGHVTKPNQPSFNAYITTSLTTNTSSTWTLVTTWSGTRFNNSSSFDTSNGRFTAPVAGEYLFSVNNNMGSAHNVKSWRLFKNGSPWMVMSYADVTASWQNLSATTLVTLNANDYIQFGYRGQPDYGYDWINVYGYLMG